MSKLLITAAALALLALPTTAETRMFRGCEWTQADNGNYWFRIDPTCELVRTGQGEIGDGKDRVIEVEAEDPADPVDPGKV